MGYRSNRIRELEVGSNAILDRSHAGASTLLLNCEQSWPEESTDRRYVWRYGLNSIGHGGMLGEVRIPGVG
jgi:hypothetical protein